MGDVLLDRMAETLRKAMTKPIRDTRLDFSEHMREQRIAIQRAFTGAGPMPASDRQRSVLHNLYAHGVPTEFKDLRDIGFALGTELRVEGGTPWTAIDDPIMFDEYVAAITTDRLTPRRSEQLAGALLHSYLTIDGPTAARENNERIAGRWRELTQLVSRLLSNARPDCRLRRELSAFPQLLDPADPTRGWPDDEDEAPLYVPESSWFWRELLVTRARQLATQPKREFQDRWQELLSRSLHHESIRSLVLGIIADRYVALDFPPSDVLRDAAIDRWGNPFDSRAQQVWREYTEQTTLERIRGWIAASMIRLFFEVLADDGSTDTRRPEFWVQYADYVTEFEVFLGRRSRATNDKRLRELRTRLGASFRQLDDASRNAFALRIGNHVFVEFSQYGNAAYAYTIKTWSTLKAENHPTPSDLRWPEFHRACAYQSQWRHDEGWKRKFAERIAMLDGIRPRRSR